MTTEVKRLTESISKRIYPETEKEKRCINEFGKMVINRGHLSKALIEVITKYEQQAEAAILEDSAEQDEQASSKVSG
jgi:hypothetical protein